MNKVVESCLSDHLYHYLKQPQVASVATVHSETLMPVVSCISWVFAKDEKVILFAIDSRSITISNIKDNPNICLHLMTEHSVYSINGTASIIENPMFNLPFNLACVNLEIEEVRDVMFYGSKITQLPQFSLTYDLKVAKDLERKVYDRFKNIID